MIKKCAMFLAVSIFLILTCGCETIKGAFKGGVAGVKKDWQNLRGEKSTIAETDAWMRENLW